MVEQTFGVKYFVLSVEMNDIVSKFLLARDKLMPYMHLKQPVFTYSACGSFKKPKKELKSLCKLKIQILFTKMSLIKPVYKIIWLMLKNK